MLLKSSEYFLKKMISGMKSNEIYLLLFNTLLSKSSVAVKAPALLQVFAHMLVICRGSVYQTRFFRGVDTHGIQNIKMQSVLCRRV